MTIVHVRKRETPFVQIDKSVFEDDRLSWKAKGLLGYLLSKPPDWKVWVADLAKRSTDGEYAVRTALQELREFGYAHFERQRDENGSFVTTAWMVFESPEFNPYRDFLNVGNLGVGNRDYSNNDDTNNDLSNNDKYIAPEEKPARSVPEDNSIYEFLEERKVPQIERPANRSVEEYKASVALALQTGARSFQENGGIDLSWLGESLRPLAAEFITCAGDQYKPVKSEISKWRKVLQEWQDMGISVAEVNQAVAYMRSNHLTIGGPESITKVARDRIGAGEQPNSIPKFHAT